MRVRKVTCGGINVLEVSVLFFLGPKTQRLSWRSEAHLRRLERIVAGEDNIQEEKAACVRRAWGKFELLKRVKGVRGTAAGMLRWMYE